MYTRFVRNCIVHIENIFKKNSFVDEFHLANSVVLVDPENTFLRNLCGNCFFFKSLDVSSAGFLKKLT